MQVIWQTGNIMSARCRRSWRRIRLRISGRGPSIDRMDYAYAAADLVLSRSGRGLSRVVSGGEARAVRALAQCGRDHQTKNAKALEAKGAAVVVPDAEARTAAMRRAMELLGQGGFADDERNLEKAGARCGGADRG